MAGVDSAADLDYSLAMNAGLAAVLSTRVIGVEALDRGEHMLELRRPLPACPLLAESGVT